MVKYPEMLPLLLVATRNNEAVDNIARTEMSSGRARQRAVFKNVPELVSGDILFKTAGEALIFNLWSENLLGAGQGWFEMPLRFPDGLQNRICRFVTKSPTPKPIANSTRYRVSVTLEVKSSYLYQYDEKSLLEYYAVAPEYIVHMDAFDIAMNREWPEA